MNMNINKSLAWGSILLALGMSTAMATTSNKGSLLIFPDIDTTDAKNTVIRITNDQSKGIDVKCYYGEYTGDDSLTIPSNHYTKPTIDFQFFVTKSQPVFWSVNDGVGTIDAPYFKDKVGELKCWAVNASGETQVKFNHLHGTATVLDQGDHHDDEDQTSLLSAADWNSKKHGDSYEYNAMAKTCLVAGDDKVPCGSVPGQLDLDNRTYQGCGRYIVGSFTPKNGHVDGAGSKQMGHYFDGDHSYDRVKAKGNFLNIASCTQDLSPTDGHAEAVVHDIVFEVWNENEAKRTGAHELADSWTRIDLGGYEHRKDFYGNQTASFLDSNQQHFTYAGLRTDSAYFRAESYSYTHKNKKGVVDYTGPAVGLIGEMVRDYGYVGKTAVETIEVGTRSGTINWAPESATAEKK
jgi:hypothetical protein